MASNPVLDAETEALIAQLVADSLDYFTNSTSTTAWNPNLGPSQIGLSYHDYEEPLSSYERQVLEDPDPTDYNEGWTAPDTPVLSPTGAALSLQSTVSLPPNERWDPDAETSEDFKQDQIMASQHKEVMEERELSGLRMPSPVPIPRGGRIAPVAMTRPDQALERQQWRLSPLAADFEPSTRSPETVRYRGRCSFRSHGALRGRSKGGVSPNDHQSCTPKSSRFGLLEARSDDKFTSCGRTRCRSQLGRLRRGRANPRDHLSPSGCSEQMSERNGLSYCHYIDDSNPNGFRNPRNADWSRTNPNSLSDFVQEREERLKSHDNLLQTRFYTSLSPDSRHVLEPLNNEEDDRVNQMTPRPTHQNKGKGKEREPSPLPAPQDCPVPRNPREGYMQHRRSAAPYFDDEVIYDPKTGDSIVYIPWPPRDPEQDRISDSKVIEIHLGETSEDECEIRELFGKMSMDDLDFESIMANRRNNNGVAVDMRRRFDISSEWQEHLGENERIASGEVPREKGVVMASW